MNLALYQLKTSDYYGWISKDIAENRYFCYLKQKKLFGFVSANKISFLVVFQSKIKPLTLFPKVKYFQFLFNNNKCFSNNIFTCANKAKD